MKIDTRIQENELKSGPKPDAITLQDIYKVSPDNAFLAVSKGAGACLRSIESFRPKGSDDFLQVRNLITSIFRAGVVEKESVEVYEDPFMRASGSGWVLARFWKSAHWESGDVELALNCLLVTGSPKGNLPYTVIIQELEVGKSKDRYRIYDP